MAIKTETGDALLTEAGGKLALERGIFIALRQRVSSYVERYPPIALIETDQRVITKHDAAPIITLYQGVYWYYPREILVTLDQTAVFLTENPRETLVAVAQEVQRYQPARAVVRLRQMTLAPFNSGGDDGGTTDPGAGGPIVIPPPEPQALLITLDGADITARCARPLSVTATEGDNRTAQVVFYPPPGEISITSYQGREVSIDRLQGGQLVPLFRGVVDVPTYDRFARTLTLACSDLRNERIGNEDKDALKTKTGGIYSSVTQREDAQGEAWVRELMKTVLGSLDYTSEGVLRYRPWALTTPRYTLQAADIHHREISLQFATRSEIVNVARTTLEYRYFERHAINHKIDLTVAQSEYCKSGTCLPSGPLLSRNDADQALTSISGWTLTALEFKPAPAAGWYTGSATVGSPGGEKVAFSINDIVRNTSALGFNATLTRYISQPKREVYEIAVTAPESIDQFDAIDAPDSRFAVETDVDPAIYEERGCVIVADADDKRGEVQHAIECVQRMGQRQMLEGHRQNHASFRYKPRKDRSGHRQFLPVEIGDTISVDADEVTVTGWVTAFTHQETKKGDRWTDVKLAVSRVDSALDVAEDWALPEPPTGYQLSPAPQGQLETPDCPVPTGDAEAPTETGFDRGRLTISVPSIPRSYVDEITGRRTQLYNTVIPRDPFIVRVPE